MNTPNSFINVILLIILLAAAIRANGSGLFLMMLALLSIAYTTALTLFFWNGMFEWLASNMTFAQQGWLAFGAYWILTLIFGTILGWACMDINSRYTISYPHALNLIGGTILGFFTLLLICAHVLLGFSYTPMREAETGPSTLLNGIANTPTNLFHHVELNWLNHSKDDLRKFPEYKQTARAEEEEEAGQESETAPGRRSGGRSSGGASSDDDWGGAVAPPGPMLPGRF
jgi:uncharacterized membrane protein YgcG